MIPMELIFTTGLFRLGPNIFLEPSNRPRCFQSCALWSTVNPCICLVFDCNCCFDGDRNRHRTALSGGLVDDILMRFTDIWLAFPPLVLALGFGARLWSGNQRCHTGSV
ncbi:MAG: hypothetical protein CM1200mP41_36810 [Gammaproteobacteria bacterium]|nr:MAG: hypothetical protein CM1200mP41_36810 [Gammaproteobacteria bacterium]